MRGPKTSLKTISLKSPPGRGQDARAHMSAGTGSGSQMLVQHEVRVDAVRRGVVNKLRGAHELLAHELVLRYSDRNLDLATDSG